MKYTSEVFQRLSRGQFLSSNSIDANTRAIYNDVEENQQEYEDYFNQIDFQLSTGADVGPSFVSSRFPASRKARSLRWSSFSKTDPLRWALFLFGDTAAPFPNQNPTEWF